MLALLGGILGLAVVIGVPLWLGANGQSAFWLVALSYGLMALTIVTSRFSVTYNLLVDGWLGRRFARTAFYTLIAPGLFYSAFLLIPFFIGRWLAQ